MPKPQLLTQAVLKQLAGEELVSIEEVAQRAGVPYFTTYSHLRRNKKTRVKRFLPEHHEFGPKLPILVKWSEAKEVLKRCLT